MPNEVKLLPCGLPPELADALLAIGEVEWGATEPKTDVEHTEALGRALDGTHAYFGTAEPTQMHGVFAKGEEIAVCHTGISPNSGKHAHLLAEAWNWLLASVRTDEVVEPSGLPQHQQPLSDIPDMVERVARAMAQASGRDPDGITAPTRGQLGSRKLWELYVPQAKAALEASHHAELVEELAEVAEVAKACAKREHQYFADRKELLLALKRSRIALNLVPAAFFGGELGGGMFGKSHAGWITCGIVNARNSLGGYSGAVPFVIVIRDGAVASLEIGAPDGVDGATPTCREMIAKGHVHPSGASSVPAPIQ